MGIGGRAPFSIVRADYHYLDGTVACQEAAYPDELSTLLGRRFIREYHRFFMDQPAGLFFVAIEEGSRRVCGLAFGGDPQLRASFVRRNVVRFFTTVLIKMVTDSRVRQRIWSMSIEAVKRKFSRLFRKIAPGASEDGASGRCGILLLICIHPEFLRRGVGSALMASMSGGFKVHGYQRACLSVAQNNREALAMYRKLGWQLMGCDGLLVKLELALTPEEKN